MANKKNILFIPLLLAFAIIVATIFGVQASETIAGPIPALVVRVIDGDTIVVRAHIWLGHDVETTIRIDGVDTPELRGKCKYEKNLAVKAKKFVIKHCGKKVSLLDISHGKYAGRVLAKVITDNGNIAKDLINAGLARKYNGGKRKPWCK